MDIEVKKSLIAAILQTENEEILEAIKNRRSRRFLGSIVFGRSGSHQ